MSGAVLITGASGQLGHALQSLAAAQGVPVLAVSRPEFDFAKPETVARCVASGLVNGVCLVINAAAYTAVDAAQLNEEAAVAGNHHGPMQLAALCAGAGIPLIHVSTDYVFDGTKGAPYTEDDATNPTGVYGATKRAGERAVLESGAQAIILRTAWVYAAHGRNFARTILAAARKTATLRVVADQRGTPTAADDLAAAILGIAGTLRAAGWRDDYGGIYHATSTGETTWHGFAKAIFEAAAPLGLTPPAVMPIMTADWPTAARRPADSRLDCGKLRRVFGITLPDWRLAVPAVVKSLLALDAPA